MSLLVLSSADVSKISSELPQHDLINLMALVFARLSSNYGITSPHRTSIATGNHNTLFMPSRLIDSGTAIKIVSVPTSSSDTRGLPASTLVINEQSGAVKAIINARKLTALRNAVGM
jgi:ornithine cyclodeaminase/alanine dehydrogenase-like protein (mu-crystallin family)